MVRVIFTGTWSRHRSKPDESKAWRRRGRTAAEMSRELGRAGDFSSKSAKCCGNATGTWSRSVPIGQTVDKSVESVVIHRNLVAPVAGSWSRQAREHGRAQNAESRISPRDVGRSNLYLKNLYLNLYPLPLWIMALLVDLGITSEFGARRTKIAFRRRGRSLRRERRAKSNGKGCRSSERPFRDTR